MNGTVDVRNGVSLPDPTIDLHWDDYNGPITSFFVSISHHSRAVRLAKD